MNLTVFISYNTQRTRLVNTLYSFLGQNGITVYTSESYNPSYKRSIKAQIRTLIRQADCVLAIFTPNDRNSSEIISEMEIGYDSQKPVIPIVEKGTFPPLSPDYPYIIYDKNDPSNTLQSARIYLDWLERSNYKFKARGNLAMGLTYLLISLSSFSALQERNYREEKDFGAYT